MQLAQVREQPKGPAYLYTALTTVVFVIIGAIALNAAQPPAPTVAEFAPQALEQIKDAPDEQTSSRGPGGQGQGTRGDDDNPLSDLRSPSPSPLPSLIPRTRGSCHKDRYGVPRQTEDPQSPPCAVYWDPEQDNGGATSFGVSENEIIVAWPYSIEKQNDTINLAAYFNRRYEFYGRKISLKLFDPAGGVFGQATAADMEKDAVKVRGEIKAFASLAYIPRQGGERHYYDALARRGVLSVDSHAPLRTEAYLNNFSPYEWSYLPSFDVMMRNFGEWICKSLEGKPPRYAGEGINKRTAPRTFGLTYARTSDGSVPDHTILETALRNGCGATPAVTVEFSSSKQVIAQFVSKGVSTVICLCSGGIYTDGLMPEATNQLFFPEWLVSSYHYQDYDSVGQNYPTEHADHILGITFHNKWLPQKDMPWYQAIKEADPYYETGDDGWASAAYERYYELLVLASGIQMAGPNLTPQSFREGLFKARFSAPGSGYEPLWYPGGGFGPGDHSMVDDAAMIWYSPTADSYTTNVRKGSFCYIGRGKRYGFGQWPVGDPAFFQNPCK